MYDIMLPQERCQSGLLCYLGKVVLSKINRGFESLPLRHNNLKHKSLIMKKYSVTSPNKLIKIDKKGDRINTLNINTEKYNALNFFK